MNGIFYVRTRSKESEGYLEYMNKSKQYLQCMNDSKWYLQYTNESKLYCDMYILKIRWEMTEKWLRNLLKKWPSNDQEMTKKWPRNDQEMTKQWPRNDQAMTKKWLRIDRKISLLIVNDRYHIFS